MYLLKVGLRPLKRSFLSQCLGMIALSVLFSLGFMIIQFDFSLQPILNTIRNHQVVTIFLDPKLQTSEQEVLVDSIETLVGARPQLTSQERFLEKMNQKYPKLGQSLVQLGSDYDSIVPRYLSLRKRLSPGQRTQIEKTDGVEFIATSTDEFTAALGAFESFRLIALLILGGLILVWATLGLYLARMNSHLQADFVQFLKLWGAEPWTARIPAMISGGVVGFLASTLSIGAMIFFRSDLSTWIQSLSPVFRSFEFQFQVESLGVFIGVTTVVSCLLAWIGGRSPKLKGNETY